MMGHLLSWFLDNWFLLPWGMGVIIAYHYGGRKLAFVVFTLGFGIFAYRKGVTNERETHNRRAEDIEMRRENAYQKIDNRNTDRDDVINRLRENDY